MTYRSIAPTLLGGGLAVVGGLAGFAYVMARKAEAAVPPLGHFLDVAGMRIHVREFGKPDRPAILLIHGLGGQMRNFPDSLTRPLADDYRVIVIDRPGSGYSARKLAASAGLAAQAASVAAIIEALGLDAPLVVGHSLGGAIALALALDHPAKVGGLALIAPLTLPQDHVPDVFRPLVVRSRLVRLLLAWTLATPGAMRNGGRAMATVFGPDPVPPNYATSGGGLLGVRPSSYYNASSDLVAAGGELPVYAARYGELACPIGILFGTADQILDHHRHGGEMAALIPGLDLEWVEGGGHMTPIAAPERTIAFIRRMANAMDATPALRKSA